MYTYLIEYNNKIIGVYNNYDSAKISIKSFFYNNFINNNIIIKSYYTNSCLLYKEEVFSKNLNDINHLKLIDTIINDIDTNITTIHNVINNQKIINNNEQNSNNNEQNIDNQPLSQNVHTGHNEQKMINNESNINNNKIIMNDNIKQIINNENKQDNNKQDDNYNQHKINFNFNEIIKEYNKDSTPINYNLVEEVKNKKLNEQKDLQHNINLLKIKKEKMKELKSIYENDLKLFHLFNENKSKSNDFVIPCMFENKYNLFTKLINENNLSCQSFIKEFNTSEINNNCDNLFIKQNNINEEFEIESDSETVMT
jgi:hypothetical protein